MTRYEQVREDIKAILEEKLIMVESNLESNKNTLSELGSRMRNLNEVTLRYITTLVNDYMFALKNNNKEEIRKDKEIFLRYNFKIELLDEVILNTYTYRQQEKVLNYVLDKFSSPKKVGKSKHLRLIADNFNVKEEKYATIDLTNNIEYALNKGISMNEIVRQINLFNTIRSYYKVNDKDNLFIEYDNNILALVEKLDEDIFDDSLNMIRKLKK